MKLSLVLMLQGALLVLACSQDPENQRDWPLEEPEEEAPYDPYLDLEAKLTSPAEMAAISHLNTIRATLGVPSVRSLEALHRAADSHGAYLVTHPGLQDPHHENPNHTLFTGETIGSRVRHQKIVLNHFWASENVSFSADESPENAVQRWLGSVFHSQPLLSPTTRYVGYARRQQNDRWIHVVTTLTWTHLDEVSAITFPNDGRESVLRQFDSDREYPDPMPSDGLVGRPISLHFPRYLRHRTTEPHLIIDRFVLRSEANHLVPGRILSRRNHQTVWGSVAFFIPLTPLDEETTYQVEASARYGEYQLDRRWSFRTMSDP